MEIAYTIGHKKSYLQAVKENGEITKIGIRKPCQEYPNGYDGGWVFKTIQEARQYIIKLNKENEYEVFGLKLENGFDKDTYMCNNEISLVNDSVVFILI